MKPSSKRPPGTGGAKSGVAVARAQVSSAPVVVEQPEDGEITKSQGKLMVATEGSSKAVVDLSAVELAADLGSLKEVVEKRASGETSAAGAARKGSTEVGALPGRVFSERAKAFWQVKAAENRASGAGKELRFHP
ncbi:hypothetical protein QQ045_012289 [Rhodiola kirilowii]